MSITFLTYRSWTGAIDRNSNTQLTDLETEAVLTASGIKLILRTIGIIRLTTDLNER